MKGPWPYSNRPTRSTYSPMLHLDKGTTTTLALTLTERTTLENPKYLIQLVKDGGEWEATAILTDVSAYPERSQIVTMQDTPTPDATAGQVTFPGGGNGTYKVWEQAADSVNLTPPDAEPLEQGFFRIHQAKAATSEYLGSETGTTYYGRD